MIKYILPLIIALAGCTPREIPESIEIMEFEVIGVDFRNRRFGFNVDLISTDDQKYIARDVYITGNCVVDIGSRWNFYLLTFKNGSKRVETIGDLCVSMKKK